MSSAVVRSLRTLVASSAMRPPCVDFERAKSGMGAKPTKADKRNVGGRKVHERYVKMFEAKGAPKYERPDEQKAKDAEIAKEYNRQMFRRHNLWSRRLTARIKLRDAAVAALPEELQEEAKKIDTTPAPRNRHIFTEYPPIKGYTGAAS